jgi:nitroreductase
MQLHLTADQVVTTTRAIGKRFDLERPVEWEIIEECVRIAQQAPAGSGIERTRVFVVVTDADRREKLAELYQRAWTEREAGTMRAGSGTPLRDRYPEYAATVARVEDSAGYLAQHLHEVPVLIVPCVTPKPERRPVPFESAVWVNTIGATWSFMLAARERGLGTRFTTLHLQYEEEAARLLGIPYETVRQVALVPVAYTTGTEFKPARRAPLEQVLHWERW